MFPSLERIRLAAYFRWERRGGTHGHDLDDWSAAEQDLLFASHYRVIAHEVLDGSQRAPIGHDRRPVCRFCEVASLEASQTVPQPALPSFLGLNSLATFDQCDGCRAFFTSRLDIPFDTFSLPFREGRFPPTPRVMPVAVFKCLARMALAILPEADLDAFPDTIEWILNPDHDLDRQSFTGHACFVHLHPVPFETPWIALARRFDDGGPFPDLLFFLGMRFATFQIAVPFGFRDDDLDGHELVVPRVATPFGLTEGRGPCPCRCYPLSTVGTEPRARARPMLADA